MRMKFYFMMACTLGLAYLFSWATNHYFIPLFSDNDVGFVAAMLLIFAVGFLMDRYDSKRPNE